MAKRKYTRHEFTEYRYGVRGVLKVGDWFRATGGPIYTSQTGEKYPFGESGLFVFDRHVKYGPSEWIEGICNGVVYVIYVGKQRKSPVVPGIMRKPHKIRKVDSLRARQKAAGLKVRDSRG
jgi:hypothetical protein